MASSATTATNQDTKLNLDELASQYGYAATFFNSDPELKQLINDAVTNQWSADQFKAKLTASNWYRSRSDALKQWQELNARDPAEVQNRINTKLADLTDQASQLGITIAPDRLKQIATDALSMGWSDNMVQDALAKEWQYKPNGGTSGGAAANEDKVRQAAGDFGVTVSDSQVASLVGGLLSGKYNQDNIDSYMRDMAMSKYPGMKQYLQQGMTVRQVASPYTQSYSQLLEVNPDTVNLTDPIIQKALQGTPDPKTGTQNMQSVYQFEQSVRNDPRWLQTNNAHQSMETTALQIAKDFGFHS